MDVAGCSSVPDQIVTWLRAVDLGARGHGAAARTLLDGLALRCADPRVASLASSTRGSLIRQSGGHRRAKRDDGRALLYAVQAGAGNNGDSGDPWVFAAWADALIGLAADGLGVGDFDYSRALLARVADRCERRAGCSTVTGDTFDDDEIWLTDGRVRLRHAWVQTELALFSGDTPNAAQPRARADALAADAPSVRHVLKTELIGAAVDAAHGDLDAAVAAATHCENRCAALGLLPLQWAAAIMLSGIGTDPDGARVRADAAAAELAARGMAVVTVA